MFLSPTLPKNQPGLVATAKPVTPDSRDVDCIIDARSSGQGILFFAIETVDYEFKQGETYTVYVTESVSAASWHSLSFIPRGIVLEGVVGTTRRIHTTMHFKSPAFTLKLYKCFIEKNE